MPDATKIHNPEAPKPGATVQEYQKPRSPYAQLPFDLESAELSQTGAQKMLLGEAERLKAEVGELKEVEKNYYATDKALAVLRAKFQKYTMLEILYTMGIAVGFAIIGWLSSSSTTTWGPTQTVATIIAVILIITAIIAKAKGVKGED